MKHSVTLTCVLLWLALPVHAAQIITPAQPNQSASSGTTITFSPIYTLSAPQDGTETGLGLRVHFNSNALQSSNVSNRFAYGLQPVGEITADTQDFDADPTTDKYFIMPWVDVTAQWPGADELPLNLATITFAVKTGFVGTTYIRTSAVDTADGAAFQTTPMTVKIAAENVSINIKAFLQGAYETTTSLMRDSLRSANLIPLAQPYADLGYTGAETTTASILNTSGANAPVDWVLVELRDKANPITRLAAKAALLQRDGDVVDAATGSNALVFANTASGNYFIALRHRNHLGIMSAAPIALSSIPRLLNFASPTQAVYGQDIRIQQGSIRLLPTGDVNHDNRLITEGPGNDKNAILSTVVTSAANPTAHINYQLVGYNPADLNLDGKTLYSGPDNDVNTLLGDILLAPDNATNSTNYIMPGSLPN
ncbi:hypothetical protein VSS37_21320 [Candidatus Thiothrix sp. Deng01]|uniref:Cohesin domain-containing protein n=1 Tax=Candidatus Thiothrix phosphatis TaxID=3112415 RepID=A0ABU6D398_9GAMM|nr:hypothetical protein [Candidatus Thiothrix sp. Deng01]MEB4593532.1 hypothetical protein [Candidatus Thiothrix sp. Deng01]